MPRKFPVEVDVLERVLRQEREHFFEYSSQKFKGPSDSVWTKISKDLNGAITAKHAYNIVTQNRKNILDKIDLGFMVQNVAPSITPNDDNINYINTTNQEGMSGHKNFLIRLTSAEWTDLHYTVAYKRKERPNTLRVYETLKPFQWTDVIHNKFFEETRLSCPITYERCNIHKGGSKYLILSGKCRFCCSTLKGVLEEEPNPNEDVIISCTYEGEFSTCQTTTKRRIVGEKRSEYLRQMIHENKSATIIRRLEAKERMRFGEEEPGNLPSLNALRVMKCSEIKKNKIHNDPIIALCILKETLPYKDVIHDIGYDRFFVHYWSSTEINNYRLYARKTKCPRVSIDATGKLVNKIKLPSGKVTAAIFLYEIVVKDTTMQTQFSVSHMLSERHDNNSIAHWLGEWLRNDIPSPKIVILDQSFALMMATVKSFTQYSTLSKYLDVCSDLLNNKGVDLPSCMIRNDFAHVMHLISRWVEIKNAPKRVKHFYLRSVALLISCPDFSEVKKLLEFIFVVALNEDEGFTPENKSTPCEIAKQYLKEKIAAPIESKFDENVESSAWCSETSEIPLKEEGLDEEDLTNAGYFQQIADIYENCKQQAKDATPGDRDNLHFSPMIAQKLLNFCKLLPIWGAVMNPIFGYGKPTESSSSSESMFNDLKNRVFMHKNLPASVDMFITEHIDSILGTMILVGAKTKRKEAKEDLANFVNNDEPEVVKSDYGYEMESQIQSKSSIENWGGEAIPNKKRRKNYLDPDPTVLKCNDSSKSKNTVVGILKNANSLHLKAIKLDDGYYTLTNTCAFDAITQILFVSYADSKNYNTFVDENKNQLIFELISNGVRDGITVQTYKKRASILVNIFKGQSVQGNENHICINTASTAFHLLDKELFKDFPSVTEVLHCLRCNTIDQFPRHVVTVTITRPLVNLQDIILDEIIRKKKCKFCGEVSTLDYTVGQHIFVEIMTTFSGNQANDYVDFYMDMQLSSIADTMNIGGSEYKLRGVISFIPPRAKTINAIGHYIAYCLRSPNNLWERVDDLSNRIETAKPNTVAKKGQILIYTI